MEEITIPEIGFSGKLPATVLKNGSWEGHAFVGDIVELIEQNHPGDIEELIEFIGMKDLKARNCTVIKKEEIKKKVITSEERGLTALYDAVARRVEFVNQYIVVRSQSQLINCTYRNCYIEPWEFSGHIKGGIFIGGDIHLDTFAHGHYEFSGNFSVITDAIPEFNKSEIVVNGVYAYPRLGIINYDKSKITDGTNWEFLNGLDLQFSVADFTVKTRVYGREVPMMFRFIASNMDNFAQVLNVIHSKEYRDLVEGVKGGVVKLTYELKEKLTTEVYRRERTVEDELMQKFGRLFKIESQLRCAINPMKWVD